MGRYPWGLLGSLLGLAIHTNCESFQCCGIRAGISAPQEDLNACTITCETLSAQSFHTAEGATLSGTALRRGVLLISRSTSCSVTVKSMVILCSEIYGSPWQNLRVL